MSNANTIDLRALAMLYESELHAIDEMLDVIGVPEHYDDDSAYPERVRVHWLIDQYLDQRAEIERLRAALGELNDMADYLPVSVRGIIRRALAQRGMS